MGEDKIYCWYNPVFDKIIEASQLQHLLWMLLMNKKYFIYLGEL